MSDFLKKFSNTSYPDMNKENVSDEQPAIQEHEYAVDTTLKQDIIEVDVVQEDQSSKTTFQTSNTRDEVYVQDIERVKKRKRIIILSITCALLLIVLGIFGYRKLNEIRVPQFIKEKTLNDVQVWAAKNKIDVDYTSVYSKTIDDGYIIKQSKEHGTILQKGDHIEVVLSKGANPDEHINVPDFMNMSLTQIEKWKQKEKAVNVTIDKVFDDSVEKSKTIRFEYKSDGIDERNYRRKDKIRIIVSKGKEVYEKDIEMPDFKDKSKGEVEAWAKENEIVLEYSEVANNKIMEGNVISQDISPKTKIAKKDVVNITISRGKIANAPNFAGMDETQSQIEATKANVAINTVYYYSNSVPSNVLISQSLPAGTEIKEQIISLTYSLGKPYISNFDETDVFTMVSSINEMNGKGAQISYEIVDANSSEKKGTIVSSSFKGCFVNIGTHIVIYVSNGNG